MDWWCLRCFCLNPFNLASAGSEGEAVLLGNDMLRAGLLHHVKYKRPFEKNGNLYRYPPPPVVIHAKPHLAHGAFCRLLLCDAFSGHPE